MKLFLLGCAVGGLVTFIGLLVLARFTPDEAPPATPSEFSGAAGLAMAAIVAQPEGASLLIAPSKATVILWST